MPGTPRGYGNIYTPHAGSMVIQVQREGGLQSRTIVLSPRQVRLLRFLMSRGGRILAGVASVVVIGTTVEAARVPMLTSRLAAFEHTATRLDTLERSLAELQKRYDQVQRMLGAAPVRPSDELTPVGDSIHRPTHRSRVVATGQAAAPVDNAAKASDADNSVATDTTEKAPNKSAAPMD